MNEDIRTADSLLPKAYQDALENLLTNELFDWYYVKDVAYQMNQQKLKQRNDGLNHVLYVPQFKEKASQHWQFIKPIIYYIEDQFNVKITPTLMRARIGMLQKAYPDDLIWNNEHVDSPFPHNTALYYVNDTDGPTYIFDQKLSDVPHVNKTPDQILKYINNTTFTPALVSEPKKGKCVIFNGERFHSSSKPKEHSTRIVISLNWK